MKKQKILIVDDEPDMLEACEDALRKNKNLEIATESSGLLAVERLRNEMWDLLLVDLKMPELDGLELLRKARELSPQTVVCMITGFPTIETAVEAVKLGAFDYVTKPFSPAQLQTVIKRALEQKELKAENLFLRRHVEQTYKFDTIIGKSPAMQKIFELIQRVADTPSDVLIVGESGTGKELVARTIHTLSRRKEERFVPVDCGAIPENLWESELFGHEKGAFTSAFSSQIGLLEFAHKGTFFLDEICELSPSLQSKLLRAHQERAFRRVGGREEIKVDVRIIAATNKDIEKEVREKRFREDLYYRINVVRINVPPLRERRGDIELLVQYHLDRYSREFEKPIREIEPEAMDILLQYPWPGNVRELQNVLKRAIALARSNCVGVGDLPDEVIDRAGDEILAPPSTGGGAPQTVQTSGFFQLRAQNIAAFEREYFRELLARCNGDATRASTEARLPRGTLYRLLKNYNLRPDQFRK